MSISRPLYGIIGGMGPSASAEFVHYIYQMANGRFSSERDYPRIILASDSAAPDRKLSFQNDEFEVLTDFLNHSIEKLEAFQPVKIMICCLVAHKCIASLDRKHQDKIVSIIDLVYEKINDSDEKFLLLASPMMYQLNLIRSDKIIHPDKDDIIEIDSFIQKLKVSNRDKTAHIYKSLLASLSKKHNVNAFVLACSDLHLANRFAISNDATMPYKVVDSLELAVLHIIGDLGDF